MTATGLEYDALRHQWRRKSTSSGEGGGGTVNTVTGSSPIVITGSPTTAPNVTHAASGATAGSYTNATVTVDAKGHVTAASSGAIALGEPLGHDVTALSHVVSHWRCLEADLGTTTLTDVYGAHDGTFTATWQASGRPWNNSEGQHWVVQKVTLGNTANLLAELLTTCGFMAWVWVPEIPVGGAVFFQFDASGESSATNVIFGVSVSETNDLTTSWEHGSGTNVNTTLGKLAPGKHHIYVGRLHEATSTIYAMVDGVSQTPVTGLANPDGGGSSVGYLLHLAGIPGFDNPGAAISDCVLFSGGLPTEAQVLAQYQRGAGSWSTTSSSEVTSVSGSGGTTGLTLTGGPTGAVTLTAGGVLNVANGGTEAATAAGARSNLGLAIGTNVQAWSALLSALAALTMATGKLPYFSSGSAAALTDLTAFIRTLLDDADAATARATLSALGKNVNDTTTGTLAVGSGTMPSGPVFAVVDGEPSGGDPTYDSDTVMVIKSSADPLLTFLAAVTKAGGLSWASYTQPDLARFVFNQVTQCFEFWYDAQLCFSLSDGEVTAENGQLITAGRDAENPLDCVTKQQMEAAIAGVGGSGTVTSVAISGGTTGLSTSGGPITTSGTITLAGTLAVANGGTGSTTASAARTALGLAIGTDVQAQDAELAAIAGLTSAADKAPYFTGSGTAALATLTTFARTILDDADAAAVRTTIGAGTGDGSATSVGLSLPSFITVSGSPVTGTGTLTGTLATQTANYGFLGPASGSAAAPTFRRPVVADMPDGMSDTWFNPLARPASGHASDFEANRSLSGDTGSIASGWTEWDPGATFTPNENQYGMTMLSTGTQTRCAGMYKAAPSGDFMLTTYCHLMVGNLITQTCDIGLVVLQDTAAPTTTDSYAITIHQGAKDTQIAHHSSTVYTAITQTVVGNAVNGCFLRFMRLTISGTATWIFSYSVNGRGWVHANKLTEPWTISGIGPGVYAGTTAEFMGVWDFLRFDTAPGFYKPCLGRLVV